MYDNLYHLHVPKTGGIWLNSHVLDPLKPSFDSARIFSRYDHGAWTKIKDSTYIVSIIRDPAKRTVSHFAYSVKNFRRDVYKKADHDKSNYQEWIYETCEETTVDNLMSWVEEREQYLSNYQSKFLTYDKANIKKGPFYYGDPDFTSYVVDEDKLYSNLSRINFLLKNSQMAENRAIQFKQKILKDLGKPLVPFVNTSAPDSNKNYASTQLWEELSPAQKSYLYDINKIDSKIYNDDSLYWNEGK